VDCNCRGGGEGEKFKINVVMNIHNIGYALLCYIISYAVKTNFYAVLCVINKCK